MSLLSVIYYVFKWPFLLFVIFVTFFVSFAQFVLGFVFIFGVILFWFWNFEAFFNWVPAEFKGLILTLITIKMLFRL